MMIAVFLLVIGLSIGAAAAARFGMEKILDIDQMLVAGRSLPPSWSSSSPWARSTTSVHLGFPRRHLCQGHGECLLVHRIFVAGLSVRLFHGALDVASGKRHEA